MAKKVKAWMCAACKYRLKEEAYYCKRCGALVDLVQAPENRIPDKTFYTRFNRFLHMNPFQKAAWGTVFAIALVTGGIYFNNLHGALTDNKSSQTFVLNVDTAYSPFGCSGTVCHIAINLENKTDKVQKLKGNPYFKASDGVLRGPADPRNGTGSVIYYGKVYCQKDFDLTFAPHEKKQFIGICTEGLPRGGYLEKVMILDQDKKVVVTTNLNALIPLN